MTGRSHHPVLNMLCVCLVISLIPVVFHVMDGVSVPFTFIACLNTGYLIVNALTIVHYARVRPGFRPCDKAIRSALCKEPSMVLILLSALSYLLFAFTAGLTDTLIANTLLNTWPVFVIILLSFLYRKTSRYQPLTLGVLLVTPPALVGVLFVSTSGHVATWVEQPPSLTEIVIGVLLGLLAAAITAFSTLQFKIASDLLPKIKRLLSTDSTHPIDDKTMEIYLSLHIQFCVLIPSILVAALMAMLVGERPDPLWVVILISLSTLINTFAVLPWRRAMIYTKKLSILNLVYLAPVLTTVWLVLIDETLLTTPMETTLFLTGLFLIVTGNLLSASWRTRFTGSRSQ